jgi:pyruvate dehydrogenase E1 component alpha subunit
MFISRFLSKKAFAFKPAAMSFSSKTIDVELPGYEVHRLEKSVLPTKTTTTKEELMKYFTDMTEMRRVEIVSDMLYKDKFIRGFCHLYDGQESITVGMEAALTWKDHIITAYRDHTIAMGRGHTAYKVIAEMMQRSTGSTQGKGGSMHYYGKKNNFYGGNGIVGAQVPVGAGIAFGIKYEGKKEVCVSMYGDGAANQGQISEASNMAGLWKLPMIFTCENNLYGMGTTVERASHNTNFYTRGDLIPGVLIMGNNVFAVREAYKWGKQYCTEDNGPLFFEIKTYRYHGHSMSDPGVTYRTREEVTEYRKTQDPIVQIKNLLFQHSLATEKELKDIEKSIKAQIDVDVEQIKKDPMPAPEELFTHQYHGKDDYYIRDCEFATSLRKDFD